MTNKHQFVFRSHLIQILNKTILSLTYLFFYRVEHC